MSATVLIPATATALTTVANVRADLGLGADTPPDAQITRFIKQASSRVSTYCRRSFARETVRQRFSGSPSVGDVGGGLLLDRSPLVRILSVTADGTELVADAFEADDKGFLYALRNGDRTAWAARNIVVDYEAGYLLPSEARGDPATTTAPDLPDDVERAVIQLVGVSVSVGGRDAMVKSENVEGVGSTDWYVQGATASLPHPEAEAALRDYRRVLFA